MFIIPLLTNLRKISFHHYNNNCKACLAFAGFRGQLFQPLFVNGIRNARRTDLGVASLRLGHVYAIQDAVDLKMIELKC